MRGWNRQTLRIGKVNITPPSLIDGSVGWALSPLMIKELINSQGCVITGYSELVALWEEVQDCG